MNSLAVAEHRPYSKVCMHRLASMRARSQYGASWRSLSCPMSTDQSQKPVFRRVTTFPQSAAEGACATNLDACQCLSAESSSGMGCAEAPVGAAAGACIYGTASALRTACHPLLMLHTCAGMAAARSPSRPQRAAQWRAQTSYQRPWWPRGCHWQYRQWHYCQHGCLLAGQTLADVWRCCCCCHHRGRGCWLQRLHPWPPMPRP